MFYGAQRFYAGLMLLIEPGVAYKTPYCSLKQAIEGVSIKVRQQKAARAILSASSIVKSENNLDLWHTPMGDY